MWLPVIFIACLAATSGCDGEAVPPAEKPFVPRYTPIAESKRQDLDLPAEGEQGQGRPPASDKKPWRRVEHGYDALHTATWPAPSAPAAILSILNPLLAPGLLLLGVNLGALLYMLLGLLGLTPHKTASRFGAPAWPSDEILYTQHPRRHNVVNEGKETGVYF